jgi:putative oxidoreductase
MKLGAPLLRAVIGPLFVGHGTQKLFGWFGGPGLEGVTGMMESMQLRPGRRHALTVALAETAGGTLLTLGALTPVATTMLTGSMVTAIRKVHAPKGVWNTGGGYEYNAVLIAAIAALIECGPGSPSVDDALGIDARGSKWALAAVAAGAAGSALAIEAGRRAEQPEPAEPERAERANGHRPERVPVGSPA